MNTMNLMNKTWDEVQVALAHDEVLTTLWAQLTECCIKNRSLNYYHEFFSYIGCGAYKEAYVYTSPVDGSKYIVKLCSVENDTIEEARILDAALDGEVAGFAPTIYLPVSIFADYLEVEQDIEDEEDGWYSEYVAADMNYVAVQPVVEVMEDLPAERRHVLYGSKLCRRIPALQGKKWFPIPYTKWIRDYSACFGAEMLDKFIDFLENEGIYDLHSGNIGYLDGKPCIFDWLS